MSKNIEQHERQDDIRVYELGFHFVPTLSEDEVAVQFSHLKSLIEKKGGTFISEETPQMTDLAYEISKTVKAQKKRYTTSYFGWVKFDINPEEIPGLEKDVKNFEPVLRYLLITTVRENTLNAIREAEKKAATKEAAPEADEASSAPQAIDESQIDKSIDELVQE